MKAEDFLELMSEVDDGLLEKSERNVIDMKKRTSLVWIKVGALAACACIVAAVGFALWRRPQPTLNELIGGTENITTDTAGETTIPDIRVELSGSRSYGLSLVEIDKGSLRYNEPYYVREDAEPTRTVTLLGKTATVKYVETCEWLGADPVDYYNDEKGNSYTFAEDGTFLSYMGESELEGFSSALYVDKGLAPDITEDEAVAIAEKTGKEVFGEVFDKVKFESVKYDMGIYRVFFYQRLGADGSIVGLRYYASILADGRIYSYGIPSAAEFRDLDESKYELVTKADIEKIAVEQYGVNADYFPNEEYIEICKKNGKYVLHVMSELRTPGTADILFEVTDVTAE